MPSSLSPDILTQAPPLLQQVQACLIAQDMEGFEACMQQGGAHLSDQRGVTALHLAAWYGSNTAASHAKRHGAEPHAITHDRENPLMWACRNPLASNDSWVMAFAGAVSRGTLWHHRTARNHREQTALHIAAAHGHLGACKILVETYFFNPNAQDHDGNTALHLMVPHDRAEGLTLLLDHGANPLVRNAAGHTPLDQAHHRKAMAAVQALDPAPDPSRLALMVQPALNPTNTMPIAERESRVRTAIQLGLDLNGRLPNGGLPLRMAVEQGWGTVVWVMLVEGSIDWSVQQDLGDQWTALHEAATNRKVDPAVLNVLVGAGAALDAQDITGETPLHVAVQAGSLDKVIALLDMGANPLVRSKRDQIPLDKMADLPTQFPALSETLQKAQVAWENQALQATLSKETEGFASKTRSRL